MINILFLTVSQYMIILSTIENDEETSVKIK